LTNLSLNTVAIRELVNTTGIVLGRIKYSETSVIARIYTRHFGLQSYLLKGVRSSKSKIKMNLLGHLSLVEIVVYHSERSQLQHLKQIRSAYNYTSIPFDVRKSSIALFLNEILNKSIIEVEPSPNLFDFIVNTIQILDVMEDHFSDFHLLFMLQLSKHLGFYPRENFTAFQPVFDLKEGLFRAGIPNHPDFINAPLSENFFRLLNTGFNEMAGLKISTETRRQLLETLITYYGLHLPSFKDIKSHEVLKVVLG